MDSFRALCSVVDFGTSRGSILSKVCELTNSQAQGEGEVGLRAWPRLPLSNVQLEMGRT